MQVKATAPTVIWEGKSCDQDVLTDSILHCRHSRTSLCYPLSLKLSDLSCWVILSTSRIDFIYSLSARRSLRNLRIVDPLSFSLPVVYFQLSVLFRHPEANSSDLRNFSLRYHLVINETMFVVSQLEVSRHKPQSLAVLAGDAQFVAPNLCFLH